MNLLFTILLLLVPALVSAQINEACGTASGTRFNLEPRVLPVPQDTTSIAVLSGAGASGSVLRSSERLGRKPCSSDFDGGLPLLGDEDYSGRLAVPDCLSGRSRT